MLKSLEWHSHSKMESEIASKIRMDERIMPFGILVCGIHGFHAHVEPKDEIVEIESHAQTVCDSHLLVELIQLELSPRLNLIFPQSPDIPAVDEKSPVEFPKQVGSVFQIEVYSHVSRLVDEVDGTFVSFELPRSQSSDAPSSHRVCTAREISFLERQHPAIAVRISHTQSSMKDEGIVSVEPEHPCDVEIPLDILRESYIEKSILSV